MLGRLLVTIGLFAILAAPSPAPALTTAEKMETCKFGADHQKLAGAARKRFIAKCMANVAPAAAPKSQ
jgi:hypothetical protein